MNNELREKLHTAVIGNDKEAFKSILAQCFPAKLVKFYSGFCENGEYPQCNAIESESLWVSSPRGFNDPFDCVLNIDYAKQIGQATFYACEQIFGNDLATIMTKTDFAKSQIESTGAEVRSSLAQHDAIITDNVFVSCFSELESLYSLRMWGHYANCHKGFCAVYDFKSMNRSFPAGILPIRYSDEYCLDDNPETDEECSAYRMQIAYTKAREWEYEKEWRLHTVAEDKSGSSGYLIPFIVPEQIYLGCKVDEELKKKLGVVCQLSNIHSSQMEIVPGHYQLKVQSI